MSRKHSAKASQLNRNHHQRQALFKTQLRALITHGQINTTLVKAKIIKRLFDKLVSTAKDGSLSHRRLVSARLSSSISGNRLVDVIVPLMTDRQSGFTTLIKTALRQGDATPTATLKLINPLPAVVPAVKKAKTDPKAKPAAKAKSTK